MIEGNKITALETETSMKVLSEMADLPQGSSVSFRICAEKNKCCDTGELPRKQFGVIGKKGHFGRDQLGKR